VPELAAFDGADIPTKVVGEELHAVADAENGDTQVEDVGGEGRRTVVIDAAWATRKDDCAWGEGTDAIGGGVPREDFGVDACFADTPHDQARVLRPVVENDDRLAVRVGVDDVSSGVVVRGVHTGVYKWKGWSPSRAERGA
jgi:hypothetical protein